VSRCEFVNALSQAEDLLPNLFVFAKLPVFLFTETINRFEADGLDRFDFRIGRHAPFDAKRFLPFVRSGLAVKQPCSVWVGRVFKHRRRADQTDTERAQVIERRAFMHSRQQMMRVTGEANRALPSH